MTQASKDQNLVDEIVASVDETLAKNNTQKPMLLDPAVITRQNKHINEQIDHPDYYNSGGIEAIDYIEAHNLNFNLGNVVKYVTRAGKKPGEEAITALKKAKRYLDREIDRIQKD